MRKSYMSFRDCEGDLCWRSGIDLREQTYQPEGGFVESGSLFDHSVERIAASEPFMLAEGRSW